MFAEDTKSKSKFYVKDELIYNEDSMALLLTLMSGLDFLTFSMELNSALLDPTKGIDRASHPNPNPNPNSALLDPTKGIDRASHPNSQFDYFTYTMTALGRLHTLDFCLQSSCPFPFVLIAYVI